MQQRTSTTEEYQRQINIIKDYINNNLDKPINLSELAEISHFSPWHFHRITRAFLGEPIGSYIVRIRLETAAKLLRYTDMSVSEIAYKVGYDVPTSLSKAFRQQYGISPIDYRTNKEYTIMKTEKKTYEAPAMNVLTIELEQGIAAGSGTGTPNPGVGDWGDGSGGVGNGDL